MPQAVSYIRFSSTGQGKGSTTERQQNLVDAWLLEHPGIHLSNLSEKDLGKSGYRGEHLNHGLGKILSAIQEGKITRGDFILVEAVDRIGRLPMLEMLKLIQSIASSGVKIITLEDRAEYSEESLNNNPSSVYVLVGKIQQAGEYSRNLSRRITASYDAKRRKARQGERISKSNPFWLDSDGYLIDEKANAVKACISLYLDGKGARKILDELYDSHPCLQEKHPSTLKRWFRSRALIGEWETHQGVIRDVYTPLIDRSTFYALRNEIEGRRREMSPEQKYLLSGLVKCNRCGRRFHIRRKKYKDTTILYANCSNYLKRGKRQCDNNTTWPYEALIAVFEETFYESLSNSALDAVLAKRAEQANALVSEIANTKAIIGKLITIAEKSSSTIDQVADSIVSHNKEILKLERELKHIEEGNANSQGDLNFGDEEIALGNETLDRLLGDHDALRTTLSRHGYKILIDGRSAFVNMTDTGRMELVLHRRSTKHKCYIMEQITPAATHLDLDDNPVEINQEAIFFAIDRKGIVCSGGSEAEVLRHLSKENYSRNHEILFGQVLDPTPTSVMAKKIADFL